MADTAQDQESVYVVLDLDDAGALPPPGSKLLLQGMTSAQPMLRLEDGTELVGAFEETVGTQLILEDAVQEDGSHRVRLVGHTDKSIRFARAAPPPAAATDSGEAAAAYAEGEAGADGARHAEVAGMEVEAALDMAAAAAGGANTQQQQQQDGGAS